MSDCPCRDCHDRTVTCHGFCTKYQTWRTAYEETLEQRRSEKDTYTELDRKSRRNWWRKIKLGRNKP